MNFIPIKLGQYASSRRDLFPTFVCQLLTKLQDKNTCYPFGTTCRIIQGSFHKSIHDLFVEIDPNPVGVGAIAQVHRAVLRNPVTEVEFQQHQNVVTSEVIKSGNSFKWSTKDYSANCAVKVIHPHAKTLIDIDLFIIKTLSKAIDAFIPGAKWLSLPDEVTVFSSMMQSQLDLRNESKHLETFNENFGRVEQIDWVKFPEPYHKSENCLIEKFIPGLPITKVLGSNGSLFDKQMGRIGLDTFLRMLILHNHVHADLHPGNILVVFGKPWSGMRRVFSKLVDWFWYWDIEPDLTFVKSGYDIDEETCYALLNEPSETLQSKLNALHAQHYNPSLVMIDAGLVSTLSEKSLENFLDLFGAVTDFDGKRVAELMIDRSCTPETVIDKTGFVMNMDAFINRVQQETLSLSKVRLSEILLTVLSMVRKHHVRLDGDFVNVAISIMLLEGVGRRLDPDLDLLKESVPLLEMAGKRESVLYSSENTSTAMKFKSKAVLSRLLQWLRVFEVDIGRYEMMQGMFIE